MREKNRNKWNLILKKHRGWVIIVFQRIVQNIIYIAIVCSIKLFKFMYLFIVLIRRNSKYFAVGRVHVLTYFDKISLHVLPAGGVGVHVGTSQINNNLR